jgi:hypothetical protein
MKREIKKTKVEKAIFISSFKTKRLDGHSIRTIYCLLESGIVNIERRLVSTEMQDGFGEIRRFGKLIYQYERMVFKFDSFYKISRGFADHLHLIDPSKLHRQDTVLFKPNEECLIKIEENENNHKTDE